MSWIWPFFWLSRQVSWLPNQWAPWWQAKEHFVSVTDKQCSRDLQPKPVNLWKCARLVDSALEEKDDQGTWDSAPALQSSSTGSVFTCESLCTVKPPALRSWYVHSVMKLEHIHLSRWMSCEQQHVGWTTAWVTMASTNCSFNMNKLALLRPISAMIQADHSRHVNTL